MKCNEAGRALIKRFEGLRLDAYPDVGGVYTIGWGHIDDVKPGMHISEHQAEAIFSVDIDTAERELSELVGDLGLNENQFSALVSFVFNLGIDRLRTSTLLKKLQAGDFDGAAAEFMKWEYAAGHVEAGLVKRRAAERALFVTPISE